MEIRKGVCYFCHTRRRASEQAFPRRAWEREIYGAIVTHTVLKNRLHALVDTGKNEPKPDSKHCDFGQWLADHANELNWSDYYPKVISLHNQFHHEADKIIQLFSNGVQEEAKEAVGSGSHFDKITQEMV